MPPTKIIEKMGQSVRRLRKYEYQPLPSVNHTRIFHLYPESEGYELRCDLEIVSTDDAVDSYEAISYVWGDRKCAEDVICNGRWLSVTTSLADALRRFRHSEKTKGFWADALCIDQSNDQEKGHQVKRMGIVYQNASRVVVWLGHDTSGISEGAIKLVREANEHLRQQTKQFDGWNNFPRLKAPYAICSDKHRWAKVIELVALPWFERVWVIQEAGLAKSCMLMWDKHEISIVDIVEFTFWVSYRADFAELVGMPMLENGKFADIFRCVHKTYGNVITWRTSTELLREISLDNKEPLFVQILDSGRRVAATDKRDHVYAFLGHPLARRPDGELLVEPNYTEENTAEDLYLDTACALLQIPKEASGLLVRVQHDCWESIEDPNLPSWVPRWDKGYFGYPLSLPDYWYTAGGVNYDFHSEISIEANKTLAVNGFIFDRICWISEPILERNLDSNIDEWEDKFRSTGRPFIESLWLETLKATCLPSPQLEQAFSVVLVQEYPFQPNGDFEMAWHLASFAAYRHMVHAVLHSNNDVVASSLSSASDNGDAHNFWTEAQTCHNRRLFYTENGRLGLGTLFTQPRDICCIFFGMPIPLILRDTADGKYRLVGDSYIYGVMRGELIEQLKEGKFEKKQIFLV